MDALNTLNLLGQKIFDNAKSKGWWKEDADERIRLIPEKIALMHSELSEALEEFRNGHPANEIYYEDGKPEGIPIEIADAIIRELDFCCGYDIDIDEAIRIKMAYNAKRPYMHGGKKI